MYRPQVNDDAEKHKSFGFPGRRGQQSQTEGPSQHMKARNLAADGREIVKGVETIGTLSKESTGSQLVDPTNERKTGRKQQSADEFSKTEYQLQPKPVCDENISRLTADAIISEPESREDLTSSRVTESGLLATQLASQKLKLRQAAYFRCSSAPIKTTDVLRRGESMFKTGPDCVQENERCNGMAQDRSVSRVASRRNVDEVGAVIERRLRDVAPHEGDACDQTSKASHVTIPLSRQLQMQRNRLTKPKLARSASVPSTRQSVRELVEFLEGKLHFGPLQNQVPPKASKSTLPHQNQGCKPVQTELSPSSTSPCESNFPSECALPSIRAEQHISRQVQYNPDPRHSLNANSDHSAQSPHDFSKDQGPSIVIDQLRPSTMKDTTAPREGPSTAKTMSNQPPVDTIMVIDNSTSVLVEPTCENQSRYHIGALCPFAKSPVLDPELAKKSDKDVVLDSRSGRRKLCSFLNYHPPNPRKENVCVFLGYKPPDKQVECMVPKSVSILARSRCPNTEEARVGQTTHISCRLSVNLTKEVDRLSCIVDSLEHKTRPYRHVSSAFDPLDIAITKVLIEESPLTIRLLPRGTTGKNRRHTQDKSSVCRRSPPMVSLFSGT